MKEIVRRNSLIALVSSSIAFLIYGAIVGVGRSGSINNVDGAVLYAAGRAWLTNRNPYNYHELVQSVAGIKEIIGIKEIKIGAAGFFYPPQSAALCVPVALFSYPYAKIVWLVLNLVSIAAIVAITIALLNRHPEKNGDTVGNWVMAAIIIGNPFTSHVVWMGQTSLMALAAIMGAWLFSQEKKWLFAGICLGIASFKPQLCLLLVIWFLLERNWKILAVALVTAGVMSIYPMLHYGPIGMLQVWYEGLHSSYHSLFLNQAGYQHKVGLESLFASVGITVPGLNYVGIILGVVLWIFQKNIDREDILAILMGITFTFFGFAHDYDYVCLLPILTCMWLYYHNRRQSWSLILPLVFLLFLPQRLVRITGILVLSHWRTVIVLILTVLLVLLSNKHQLKRRLQKITSEANVF